MSHVQNPCWLKIIGDCLSSILGIIMIQEKRVPKNQPVIVKQQNWLVVLTILKHISHWEGLSHILWKINNV